MGLTLKLSKCYIDLELYEDALQYADACLKIDPEHKKGLYYKAKSLAFLYCFDESIKLFTQLGKSDEIEAKTS